MTDTVSHDPVTSTTTTTTSEYIPCVRYGFPEESDNPHQAPTVRPINAPVPEEAETASPVYLLTDDQYERHQSLENPYGVAHTSCIATALQDECEQTDHVVYPIHIESDAFPKISFETTIQHITEFVETKLGCAVDDCTFYYSGNRSIHAHVPKVVTSEQGRERLKEWAAQFSDEADAEFDLGIYSRKRQFRLPGVAHQKTGMVKVEVEPEWEHDRIVRHAASNTSEKPTTYEEILMTVFAPLRQRATRYQRWGSPSKPTLIRKLGGSGSVLSFDCTGSEINCPLIEQEQHPNNPTDIPEWAQYNYHEFSPYAHANGNARSVAVVKVMGGAFARKEKRKGATMVPAYFHGAHGCNGEAFTKTDEHAPLQLSKRDYEKWDYDEGDHVVIIGGQSRNSRIFTVESWHATVAAHALTSEEGGRQASLAYLEDKGYEVGKSGSSGPTCTSNAIETRGGRDSIVPIRLPRSEAATLQQKAEQDGIETLTHMERWRVACRLLLHGWEPAWEWFKSQFGADFKPELTCEQFRSVIESYPGDYNHVEVSTNP